MATETRIVALPVTAEPEPAAQGVPAAKPRSARIALAALALSVLLGAAAQVGLKSGMTHAAAAAAGRGPLAVTSAAVSDWRVVGGVAAYGVGTALWVLAVSGLPIGFAYPVTSLGYVLVLAASWGLLGEPLSLSRAAGALMVVAGVALSAPGVGRGAGGRP